MTAAGVRADSVKCSILLKSLTVHSITREGRHVTDLIGDFDARIDEVLLSCVVGVHAVSRTSQGFLENLIHTCQVDETCGQMRGDTGGARTVVEKLGHRKKKAGVDLGRRPTCHARQRRVEQLSR